ncbi:hypothetical protein ABPG72_017514 [Tetrahymena utriculariae]
MTDQLFQNIKENIENQKVLSVLNLENLKLIDQFLKNFTGDVKKLFIQTIFVTNNKIQQEYEELQRTEQISDHYSCTTIKEFSENLKWVKIFKKLNINCIKMHQEQTHESQDDTQQQIHIVFNQIIYLLQQQICSFLRQKDDYHTQRTTFFGDQVDKQIKKAEKVKSSCLFATSFIQFLKKTYEEWQKTCNQIDENQQKEDEIEGQIDYQEDYIRNIADIQEMLEQLKN